MISAKATNSSSCCYVPIHQFPASNRETERGFYVNNTSKRIEIWVWQTEVYKVRYSRFIGERPDGFVICINTCCLLVSLLLTFLLLTRELKGCMV